MLNPNKIANTATDPISAAVFYVFHAARTETETRRALPRATGPQRAAMVSLVDACEAMWYAFSPRAFSVI